MVYGTPLVPCTVRYCTVNARYVYTVRSIEVVHLYEICAHCYNFSLMRQETKRLSGTLKHTINVCPLELKYDKCFSLGVKIQEMFAPRS